MPTRSELYALTRQVAYFLVRGESQTIEAPIRYGAAGALVAPDSGTVTITGPDGDLVTAQAVTVSNSVASYTLTPSATATEGEGYQVQWSLTIDGQSYPFNRTAVMTDWFPHSSVSVLDLYKKVPALETAIPQRQSSREGGDNTGWQPQLDDALYSFIGKLMADGRPVWKLRTTAESAYQWVLTKALHNCVLAIPRKEGSTWYEEEKTWRYRHRDADRDLRLQYTDNPATLRKRARPYIRLAPTGRGL